MAGVALLLLPFYLLLVSLRIDSGDGEEIYQVTRSLVEGRGFAVPPPSAGAVVVDAFGGPISPEQLRGGGPYGAWGRDGRYYAQYGVGQSLLAAPLYLLGRWAYRVTGWGTEGFATRAAVTLLGPLTLALSAGAVAGLARRLGYRPGSSIAVALVTGIATPLWVYSKTFFSEPLVTLGLTAGALAALEGAGGARRAWVVSGIALGATFLVKPVALVVAPAFLAYAATCKARRMSALTQVAGPLGAALLAVAAYNWTRFGSPLDTGYRTAAWNVSPWVGASGLLVSPGKGLLWYCPPLVLALAGLASRRRRQPQAWIFLEAIALLYLAVHSVYNHWHGGGCWGPRLILPVVPFLVLPVADWLDHPPRLTGAGWVLAALLAAGVLVQLPAVLVHPGRALEALYERSASPAEYTFRLLYRPADSPLVGQWRALLEVAALMRDPAARMRVVAMARTAEEAEEAAWDRLTSGVGYLSFNTFDLWPVYWGLLGAPWLPLLAVEGLLAAWAVWAAWRMRGEAV